MRVLFLSLVFLVCAISLSFAQSINVQDNFEGNGTITAWHGDDCNINTDFSNPFQQGINPSAKVLSYQDQGGQFANVRFDVDNSFNLSDHHTFSLKIYVPASSLTGNQPNQVSLKLQNNNLGEPWVTQSEIIKPIVLDQWQTVTFDFENDNFINFEPNSAPPTQRSDFNRVVIQINGENNTDHVLAYIDDLNYDGTVAVDPVFNNLVWSDEFDGNGALDDSKWFHQTQLPNGESWYNNEQQHYTDRLENSSIEDGILRIVARKETFTDQGQTKEYTSARLNSKFAFTYGKVEIRAKLPAGVGTWPAIWTLGQNITEPGAYWETEGYGTTPWPACGEIDIMEHWGHNQNYVQSATHTPSSHGNTINHGGQTIGTVSSDFHIYTLEWTAQKLVFSVDDVIHFTYNPMEKTPENWPFDANQYLLLNVAIQAGIDPAFTESAMEIDYIRIYQESSPTSVTTQENGQATVYPNPASDSLHIELLEKSTQPLSLQLYNIDGKFITSYATTVTDGQITIDKLGELPAGIYLIEFEIDEVPYRLKFIKG